MIKISSIPCLVVCAAFCCGSCGDDPGLVAKREKQRAEISRLKGELALIEEQLKNMPPDVTAELEKARKTEEEQTTLISAMETEVNELQSRKRELQVEFDSYRAKYQLK